jgi:hypothetical protein
MILVHGNHGKYLGIIDTARRTYRFSRQDIHGQRLDRPRNFRSLKSLLEHCRSIGAVSVYTGKHVQIAELLKGQS